MMHPTECLSSTLAPGYSVAVDTVGEAEWHRIVGEFADGNIYQTWAYEEVQSGRQSLSHLVLRKDSRIVAAAQARIVKLPVVGVGVAYVRWGPLWRSKSQAADREAFRQAVRALRSEYVEKRGLVLRLRPVLFRETSTDVSSVLAEEGYALCPGALERTIRLDLTRSTEELRTGMRQHWRRYLRVAERENLEIVEGTAEELFDEFAGIYRELLQRKQFAEPNDIRKFRTMQARLPEKEKLRILLCRENGKLCAGLICSAIGDTAIYLYGATSNAGLKARGSYLLHWRLIERLKEAGIAVYDLHGINPETNPGTYKFKADMCGANGQDLHFIGQFEAHPSLISHWCIAIGDRLRLKARALRQSRTRGPSQPTASPAS